MLEFGEPSSASDVVTVYEYAESSVAVVTSVLVMLGALGWSDSIENWVAARFALPYASVAVPAATSIVTVPSADGVIVAVYVVPLPANDAEPPLTVISLTTKLVVVSEKVIVTANVEPVAGLDALVVIVTVGEVSS